MNTRAGRTSPPRAGSLRTRPSDRAPIPRRSATSRSRRRACPSRCRSVRPPARAASASDRPSGSVAQAARGGETERAGTHRICGDLPHLRDVRLIGLLQPHRPLAHDEHAHRGVRQQRAQSMSRLRRSSASRYSANDSHSHFKPSCMTGPGMSSTPSISSTSFSRSAGLQGRSRRRSCPSPRSSRRGTTTASAAVPHRLPVVVRVDVDEARRDQLPLASISSAPLFAIVPISAMRSPLMATSARSARARCRRRRCRRG